VNHLNFGGHNHISGTADRLRRCRTVVQQTKRRPRHCWTRVSEVGEVYYCYAYGH